MSKRLRNFVFRDDVNDILDALPPRSMTAFVEAAILDHAGRSAEQREQQLIEEWKQIEQQEEALAARKERVQAERGVLHAGTARRAAVAKIVHARLHDNPWNPAEPASWRTWAKAAKLPWDQVLAALEDYRARRVRARQ